MFDFVADLIRREGLQAAREFVSQVNAHITVLEAWEKDLAAIRCATSLRGTPEPKRSECDSDKAFESVLILWREAQTRDQCPSPAPSAPIPVERSIAVHTSPDGFRTFTYAAGTLLEMTVYRDRHIQRAKEISDANRH